MTNVARMIGPRTGALIERVEEVLRMPGVDGRAWVVSEAEPMEIVGKVADLVSSLPLSLPPEDLDEVLGGLGRQIIVAMLLDLTEERRQHLRSVD